MKQFLKDIVVRDIVSRYQIRDQKILVELAIYLITNVGKEFSYTRLKNQFDLGSTNTVINYISYLEDSYFFLPYRSFRFLMPSKEHFQKNYSVDTGLSKANSASLSSDRGRLLENIVFLHLRRGADEIYYYKIIQNVIFL